MDGRRRDDPNLGCPYCGSKKTYPYGKKQAFRYACRECGRDFIIDPKCCSACGTWVADDAEYCEWHARHGFDDGKDDLFVPAGVCTRCRKRPTHDIFELCAECLDREKVDYRKVLGRTEPSSNNEEESHEANEDSWRSEWDSEPDEEEHETPWDA